MLPLFFFCLGMARHTIAINSFNTANKDLFQLTEYKNPPILVGQIIKAPEPNRSGTKVVVGLLEGILFGEKKPIQGKLELTIKNLHYSVLRPGDIIRFQPFLRKIENFKTPGVFDEKTYMALKGIGIRGYLSTLAKAEVIGHLQKTPYLNPIHYYLENFRHKIAIAMDDLFEDNIQGIAAALVIGQKSFLTLEARKLFKSAGLTHLFAVSGLHMALMAAGTGGVIYYLLLYWQWLALRMRVRKIAILIAAFSCLLYAGVAGFSPSAIRASTMFLALAASLYADKPYSHLHALSLSAWCLLLYNPLFLFSVGFQLSYAATFFIIFIADLLKAQKIEGIFIKKEGIKLFIITLVAYAATAPLVMYHFQRLSLAGPLMNLFFVPLISFTVLPILLIGTIFFPFSHVIASFFWSIAGFFIDSIYNILHLLPVKSFLFWYPRPWQWQIALSYMILLGIFIALTKFDNKNLSLVRPFFKGMLLFFIFFFLIPYERSFALKLQKDIQIHILDVGQGTCQVIVMPGGKTMVVDAGGFYWSKNMGTSVVGPFLRTLGVRKIDVLALSHPEQDHMGGMLGLFEQFPIEEFWSNQDQSETPTWHLLKEKIEKSDTKWTIWHEPAIRKFKEIEVNILPSQCLILSEDDLNNRSLLFHIIHKKFDILFTGDIEHEREKCLIEKGIKQVDTMVVPHHGSKTSSSLSFLETVKPQVAVVPVGYKNRFRLPNPNVLKSYHLIGTTTYRTDLDGTVTIKSNGSIFTVSTFSKSGFIKNKKYKWTAL